MILLDHLTRGRAMMGVGPGALPTDAAMIGIDPLDQRAALEEDFDVLLHLLTSDEPISVETKRYRLVDARSQYRPYTDPCFDIGVAAIALPSGPRLAGRYGVGLLSVGATISEGFDVLNLGEELIAAARGFRVGPLVSSLARRRGQTLAQMALGVDASPARSDQRSDGRIERRTGRRKRRGREQPVFHVRRAGRDRQADRPEGLAVSILTEGSAATGRSQSNPIGWGTALA
jgi:alkanesulfonate monooxygenase SsuD/methylene tetrahydromethanopterin reductase-like flavin-dependent oxidoreductase (luciferase family)